MAELTTRERLQPCLLDRLRDDDPAAAKESRDKRVVSLAELRRYVLRDLEWLLNSPSRLEREEADEFPEVASSVLNFGVPDFTGRTSSSLETPELERLVLEAVTRFEPRIMRRSLAVKARISKEGDGANSVVFEVRGELWAQPVPDQMFVKTQLDLETGQYKIEDRPYG